jgi:hypothetical protein
MYRGTQTDGLSEGYTNSPGHVQRPVILLCSLSSATSMPVYHELAADVQQRIQDLLQSSLHVRTISTTLGESLSLGIKINY